MKHYTLVLATMVWLVPETRAQVGSSPTAVGSGSVRPRGTYIKLQPGMTKPAYVEQPSPRVLFMNRDGGTYHSGWPDDSTTNTSSIPYDTSRVSEFAYGDTAWERVMDCVRDLFAPYAITVTDEDPGDVPHIESVVGGYPGELGKSGGVGGVAPMDPDCGIVETAIVFIFASTYGNDPQGICEVVGQESGHALGLDHAYYCLDAMTYLSGCGDKIFTDEDVPCGEYDERTCSCGGATQNSHEHLMEVLGPGDTSPPAISIDSPSNGSTVGSQFTVTATASDDSGVARVLLALNGTIVDADDDAPFELVSPADLAPRGYTIGVTAIDVMGNESMDSIDLVVVRPCAGDTDCNSDERCQSDACVPSPPGGSSKGGGDEPGGNSSSGDDDERFGEIRGSCAMGSGDANDDLPGEALLLATALGLVWRRRRG